MCTKLSHRNLSKCERSAPWFEKPSMAWNCHAEQTLFAPLSYLLKTPSTIFKRAKAMANHMAEKNPLT